MGKCRIAPENESSNALDATGSRRFPEFLHRNNDVAGAPAPLRRSGGRAKNPCQLLR
jgi:hypothetical protein